MANEPSLGALWKRQTSAGELYLSGQIDLDGKKTNIIVFKNSYKKEDKHPDYRIYVQRERTKAALGNEDNKDAIQIEKGDIPF